MCRKLPCFAMPWVVLILTLYCFNSGLALEEDGDQKTEISLSPELKAPENLSVNDKVEFYFKKARKVMDDYTGDTTFLKELAIPYSEEIIKIAPDSPYGYYGLSRCAGYLGYYSGNKYDHNTIKQGALPLAKKAVELGPKISLMYMNLAMCYSYINEHTLALKNIDEAINLSESEQIKGLNMVHYGMILVRAGRQRDALNVYLKAETRYPLDPIAKKYLYDNLSLLYVDLKKYAQGIDYATKLCSLTPDNPWAWHNLGVAYQKVGRYDEAINCEEKALGLMDFGAARSALSSDYTERAAELMKQKKDLPIAQKYLMKAIELNPENSSAYQVIVEYYLSKKDFNEAQRYLLKLFEIDPDNKWGFYTRRQLEFEMGSGSKQQE